MSDVFSENYSDYYDLIYREKDYAGECALVEHFAATFLGAEPQSVLDLGCGTGGHLVHFARRGWECWGVDRSESMLARAAKKAEAAECSLKLQRADLAGFALTKTDFSLAVCMFAVMGYLTANDRLAAALRQVRRHMREGGIFVFDFWYGPAVIRQQPEPRSREFVDGDRRLVRRVRPLLDTFNHVVHNRYELQAFSGSEQLAAAEETHSMRFFFPQELSYFLDQQGFRIVHFSAFPEVDREPDEEHWNSVVVAQAQ